MKGNTMFHRAFQVRIVKNKKEEPLTETDKVIVYDNVANAVNKVIRKVAMGALAYVVVDTARQVLVARAINSNS